MLFRSKRRALEQPHSELTDYEEWWRDRYFDLKSRGYLLRSRLHPEWIPSWEKSRKYKRSEDCEDFLRVSWAKVVDATRISDGTKVCLKKLKKNTPERAISVFLSSPEKINDLRNHCVPIIDHFDDPHDDELEYIVTPLLREFDDPPFVFVSEVVEFVRQTLEGLSFIHNENVAHRDCSDLNIMMDGSNMYPGGFHPIAQFLEPDGKHNARYKLRAKVSVKYYFIDFGLSTHFTNPNAPRLVTGSRCQDREAPELSDFDPYDPFALDVFLLGNVYRTVFIKNFPPLEFLKPLAEAMTQRKPDTRPKIDDAVVLFEEITQELSETVLHSLLDPPHAKGPSLHERVVRAVRLIALDLIRQLRSRLASHFKSA